MADIFISYAREDRPRAQLLAEIFEGRGWSVWWDTRLKAGEVWDEVIERELSAACCVVVLWSRTSVSRYCVRVEAGESLERRILVPALIEDVRPPLAFRLVQAEHLLDWSGEPSHPSLNRLLAAVSECLRTHHREDAGAKPAADTVIDPRNLPDLAVFKDIEAPWCPELVVLPAGEFWMGSPTNEEERFDTEGPQHRVRIGQRFAVGKHAATVGEYRSFVENTRHAHEDGLWRWTGSKWEMDASKNWRNPGFSQTDRHPVVGVSWDDAKAYAAWLSRETGQSYRLLTEAEWEYACRAGTTTARFWGESADQGCPYANGADLTAKDQFPDWTVANCHDGYVYTAPVGAFRPNRFGLYDMLGNVWEWVEDVWHDNYKGAPEDGGAWLQGGDQGVHPHFWCSEVEGYAPEAT